MNRPLADELTQAAAQSLSGAWRTIATFKRLGVSKALGLTEEEWFKKYLGNYVQLAIAERYDAVIAAKDAGLSNRQIAKAAGVDERTVRNNLRTGGRKPERKPRTRSTTAEKIPQPLTEIAAVAITEEQHAAIARDNAKAEAAAQSRAKREASQRALPSTAFDLRIGDAREVLADVPSDSVDLILTDPPYGDAAEPLYQWLGEFSARVLVPGGSLVCFTGQARLDRDMDILRRYLRWWWLVVLLHNPSQRLPGKFVIPEFKPVMWFVKDHRHGRTLVSDVLRSAGRDKDGHPWGQGDGGIKLLVQQLTDPDGLVVDPFAGTARWGEIVVGMGRRWTGADVVRGGAATVVV